MNNFYKKYRVVGNWINILLLATVLTPLLALSYYNHPSPADDFCYIWTDFNIGWFEAMKLYYTTWTGRYFGIFMNHSNPLFWHSFVGFKILPVVLISAMIFGLYSLFRHLTPTLSRLAHFGFAGIVFFLYILKIASIAEAFYWMAAFVSYTVPNILTLLLIVLVLRWYRQDTQGAKLLISVLAGFLIFAIVGCSETNLIIALLLVAAWWFYRLVFHRKADMFMIAMLVVSVFSAYLFFSSPGNAQRMGGNPLSGNFMFSFTSSFLKLALLSLDWILRTPLIFFTFAWMVVLSRLSTGARNYFSVPVWFAVLLFVGILAAQLFPSYYGVGIEPTARVINCVYLYFLIGWFYVVGVVFHYLQRQYASQFNIKLVRYGLLYFVLVVSICVGFVRSVNVKMLYRDLYSGTAAAFDKESFQRYALIQASKEPIVYVPLIKNRPLSLYIDDISDNQEFLWNRCLAGYFGKEAIHMKEDRSEQK